MDKKRILVSLIALILTTGIIIYCLVYGNQYTVKFDTNGGSEILPQTIRVGQTISEPEIPAREGYKFIEWQLYGEKFDFNSPIKANIVLKAKWQKMKSAHEIYYTVTFDSSGGSTVEEQYIAVGETVDLPTNPVFDGYTFDGWYYNDILYQFDKEVSQDMTLTAKWKENNKEEKQEEALVDKEINNDNELKVSDVVIIIGPYAESATDKTANHIRAKGWKRVILKVYEDSEYPYRVGNEDGTTGYFKASSLEKVR